MTLSARSDSNVPLVGNLPTILRTVKNTPHSKQARLRRSSGGVRGTAQTRAMNVLLRVRILPAVVRQGALNFT